MLNFTGAIRTGYGTTYGYASGVVWLSQVDCEGNETNIAQCSFPGWGINNCYHYYDVNVICDSEFINYRVYVASMHCMLQCDREEAIHI